MTCEARFENPLFDVTRAMERVHFGPEGRLNEVQVTHAEGFGVFCSAACRTKGIEALMAEEKVPVPRHPPDIGPVEVCAICSSPVDMTVFHLTYSQCEVDFRQLFGQPSDHEYLAVVCDGCSRFRAGSAQSMHDNADFTTDSAQMHATVIVEHCPWTSLPLRISIAPKKESQHGSKCGGSSRRLPSSCATGRTRDQARRRQCMTPIRPAAVDALMAA